MDRQGDAQVSTLLKQALVLAMLLSSLAQPALANSEEAPLCSNATAPAEAPVRLGWDRVGERDRTWA